MVPGSNITCHSEETLLHNVAQSTVSKQWRYEAETIQQLTTELLITSIIRTILQNRNAAEKDVHAQATVSTSNLASNAEESGWDQSVDTKNISGINDQG